MTDLARRAFAEGIGTYFLVLIGPDWRDRGALFTLALARRSVTIVAEEPRRVMGSVGLYTLGRISVGPKHAPPTSTLGVVTFTPSDTLRSDPRAKQERGSDLDYASYRLR